MKEQLALFYKSMLMNARCAHFRFLIKRDKLISALNCENHSSKVLESRFYFSDINLDRQSVHDFIFSRFDANQGNRGINCSRKITSLQYTIQNKNFLMLVCKQKR